MPAKQNPTKLVKIKSPVKFRNKLSRHSILALLALVGLTAAVIIVNPFNPANATQTSPRISSGSGASVVSQLATVTTTSQSLHGQQQDHGGGAFGNSTGFFQFDN